MPSDLSGDYDPQDQSEVFDADSTNLDGDGDVDLEMRTFEEMAEVLDVTSALGDADDEDALIGEEMDDDEIIDIEAGDDLAEDDDGVFALVAEDYDDEDEAGLEFTDDTDAVQAEGRGTAARMESTRELSDDDLEDLGYRDKNGLT